MRWRLLVFFALALIVVCVLNVEGKRSGGGRVRVTKTGSSFWGRRNKNKDSSRRGHHSPAPAPPPPPEPVKKEVVKPVQHHQPQGGGATAPEAPRQPAQSAPTNQRPIGWDVPHSQKTAHQAYATPDANQKPPPYPGAPGGYAGSHANAPPPGYPSAVAGYPAGGGAYPAAGGYGYGGGHQGGYNQQQPYPGYYPTSNIGVVPPRGADHGQYYNSMGGMGGQTHLFGGMGGMGGGYGYGYPMKKSGGFFSGNAFRNVLAGMFIWHMVSGLTKKPYHVYNYYNQPETQREEITLPPNVLVLCSENATSLCASTTTAICTSNQTILCVASAAATSLCTQGGAQCVNATIPCLNDDPLCRNGTAATLTANATTVNLPCFTNMTLTADPTQYGAFNLPRSEGNRYCVTTMAVPDANTTATAAPAPPNAATPHPDLAGDNTTTTATAL